MQNGKYVHLRQKINITYNKSVGVLHLRFWNKLVYFSIRTLCRRRETFEILDFYEAPPSHSNGSYILGVPFLFSLTVSLRSIGFNSTDRIRNLAGYFYVLFEVILCIILTFCLASMFRVVYKQNSRDRTLIMQLQFNQRVTRVKTRNMSAVKWVALVTCVFLLCYGILMRCSFLVLTGRKCTDDLHYKLPVQVINSGLNPIAYAMFKRDIKQECKRYLFKRSRCLTTEQLLW